MNTEKFEPGLEDGMGEKPRRESVFKDLATGPQLTPDNELIVTAETNKLKRNLHGRHMQMIAIGMLAFPAAKRQADHMQQVVPSVLVFSSALAVRCTLVARVLWSAYLDRMLRRGN